MRTQFFTPYLAEHFRQTEFRPIPLGGSRDRRDTNSSQYDTRYLENKERDIPNFRWLLYKELEGILNRKGEIGHVCILRAICEYGEGEFHYESGLLGEILHIILT